MIFYIWSFHALNDYPVLCYPYACFLYPSIHNFLVLISLKECDKDRKQ